MMQGNYFSNSFDLHSTWIAPSLFETDFGFMSKGIWKQKKHDFYFDIGKDI